MVDVGTHSLHINCVGRGSPTVILEAANLGMSAHWVRVQQLLAKTTRVCAYDRAGMGWSEPSPEPRDARQISSELHTLLNGAADTETPRTPSSSRVLLKGGRCTNKPGGWVRSFLG